MSKFKKLLERVNCQHVYLINMLRQIVMRSVPGMKLSFFAKQKKGIEYPVHFTADLVSETLHNGKEITKKYYEKY